MILQFLTNGLIEGCLIAIMALGFALIYNTTHVFHMAYSVIYMITPYFFMSFYNSLGLNSVLAIILSLLFVVLLHIGIEIGIYQTLNKRRASHIIQLIASLGVMTIVINIIALSYGNESKILDNNFSESITIWNILITQNQLFQFLISALVIIVYLLFLRFTNLGISIRALSNNEELTSKLALDNRKLRIVLFAISGLLAGVAGLLNAWDVGMDPYVGMPALLNAIVAVIIGGLGKYNTAIIGGILLGLLQAVVIWKFSTNWAEAVSFVVLIIFLLVRPQGLFGQKIRTV